MESVTPEWMAAPSLTDTGLHRQDPKVAREGPGLGQPPRAGLWLQALCPLVYLLPPPESKGPYGGWTELC